MYLSAIWLLWNITLQTRNSKSNTYTHTHTHIRTFIHTNCDNWKCLHLKKTGVSTNKFSNFSLRKRWKTFSNSVVKLNSTLQHRHPASQHPTSIILQMLSIQYNFLFAILFLSMIIGSAWSATLGSIAQSEILQSQQLKKHLEVLKGHLEDTIQKLDHNIQARQAQFGFDALTPDSGE